jgi:hypothetical protein
MLFRIVKLLIGFVRITHAISWTFHGRITFANKQRLDSSRGFARTYDAILTIN